MCSNLVFTSYLRRMIQLLWLEHVSVDMLTLPGCWWTMGEMLTTRTRWGYWTCCLKHNADSARVLLDYGVIIKNRNKVRVLCFGQWVTLLSLYRRVTHHCSWLVVRAILMMWKLCYFMVPMWINTVMWVNIVGDKIIHKSEPAIYLIGWVG